MRCFAAAEQAASVLRWTAVSDSWRLWSLPGGAAVGLPNRSARRRAQPIRASTKLAAAPGADQGVRDQFFGPAAASHTFPTVVESLCKQRALLVKLLDDQAEEQPTTVDRAGRCSNVKRAVRRPRGSPDKAEVSGSSPLRPTHLTSCFAPSAIAWRRRGSQTGSLGTFGLSPE